MGKTSMEHMTPDSNAEGAEKLNPWLTVWYRPRATVRSAINHRSLNVLIFLAMMAGITYAFDRAISKNMGDDMATIMVLLFVIVVGAIAGIVSWFIWSVILYYSGKLLNGKGTPREMDTGLAISFIPLAFSGIFCVLDVLFLREKLFADAMLSPFQIGWLLFSAFIVFILSLWSFFLMIKAVAEVHRFSSWKGLLAIIIPGAVLLLIILGILLIAMI